VIETPFSAEGREIAALLKRKAPDEDVQPVIERIHSLALDAGLDPLVTSTDIFVTSVLHVGNKSLSHVLATIERTKDRLLDAGAASEAARSQIITAIMSYWSAQPGVAISIIGKLLNYSILSPAAVIQWTLVNHAGASRGETLSHSHIYEMVFNTVSKVTGRVRQVAQKAATQALQLQLPKPDMDVDDEENGADAQAQAQALDDLRATRDMEIKAMRDLFKTTNDVLTSWADGTKDEMLDLGGDGERERLVRRWGQRWLRVFRRRSAIEETFVVDALKEGGLNGEARNGSS